MPSLKHSKTAEDSQAIMSDGDSANPNPAYFSPENPTRNYKKISKRSPTAVEHDTQGQPPKKRQRKSPVQGDTAARNSLARKARGLPEVARANDESVVTVDRPNSKRGRVIGKGKSLKWFDEQDNQWKPAGYHHEYRAKLLALAAQQPGAPFYSEDMGTDITSYSPLTQGWTADPDSVRDFRGRPVFSIKKHEAGWTGRAQYGPLLYNGIVMLDCKDNPVRDVPGLPLTLQTEAPAWLLAGLRRCMSFTIDDLMARRPTTRETLSGTKDNTGNTALTQSISRWLQLKHIEEWNQRQKNKGKKQRLRPATPDHQGPEMMEEPYLLPAKAGTDLRNLPGGFPNCGSYFSTETPREPMMSPYDQYYNDQQGTVFPALRENNHQRNDEPFRESHPPFGYNPHGLLANEAYPPAFHYQTTAWSVGDHTQTQYYNDQMFLAQDTPSAYQVPSYSSISNNTQYGLFDSGEDFYTDETQLHLQNTRYLLESPPALGVVDPNFMELMHGQTPRALEKSPIG